MNRGLHRVISLKVSCVVSRLTWLSNRESQLPLFCLPAVRRDMLTLQLHVLVVNGIAEYSEDAYEKIPRNLVFSGGFLLLCHRFRLGFNMLFIRVPCV